MKFTATAIAASLLVSGAVAEKPFFTNNEINPVEGEPFELTFTGCDEGCKITLQKGPNKDSLKSIQTLACKFFFLFLLSFFFFFFLASVRSNVSRDAADATGGSLSVTLTNLESGDYNFYIENNEDNLNNYSKTFEYTGTATSSDSSSSSSVESASKTSSKSETSMKTSAPASTTSGSRTSSSTGM
jgi:hypothetical protein